MTDEADVVTPQHPPNASNAEVLPADETVAPRFGALKASFALVFLIIGQMVAGIVVVIAGMIVAVVRGRDISDPSFSASLVRETVAPLLLASAAVSVLVVFAVTRAWAWHLVRDKGSDLGMTAVGWSRTLSWCAAGASVAAAYVFVAPRIIPFDPSTPLGPLASAASRGGVDRLAWAILALVFAPLVEEFFFRGLLLAGFAHSWGSRASAIAVTVLFVLLHLFETFRYWPATVAVTLLAVGALAARRSTGSLWPAVTFHWGYNFVIVLSAFLVRGTT